MGPILIAHSYDIDTYAIKFNRYTYRHTYHLSYMSKYLCKIVYFKEHNNIFILIIWFLFLSENCDLQSVHTLDTMRKYADKQKHSNNPGETGSYPSVISDGALYLNFFFFSTNLVYIYPNTYAFYKDVKGDYLDS